MQVREVHLVHDFFNLRLGLHWSDDFRGVLYVPECFLGKLAAPGAVAIALGDTAFIGGTCCMHSVIQRPDAVTRKIVRETFEFPFEICHCEVVLALVDSTNAAALRFDTKLGFHEGYRVSNGGPDGDLIVLEMQRVDCRWLKHNVH